MSLPTIEPLPDEDPTLTPAQRRLRRRVINPPEGDEQAAYVRELSMLAAPSFDFYLFTLLAGLVLAVGLILDAPALFVLAALLAPFLAPLVGAALGLISGQARFTLQSLVALLLGGLVIFLCGMAAGWVTNLLEETEHIQAALHARLDWTVLAVLVIGAGLAGFAFTRNPDQKPLVASAALAYVIYLPLGAAGFGLSAGIDAFWPQGLLVAALHALLAVALCVAGLALAGLRPWRRTGLVLTGVVALAAVGLLAAGASGMALPWLQPARMPAVAVLPTQTLTPSTTPTTAPTIPPTPTTAVPTATVTATRTREPTRTPTETPTPTPTPIEALIFAEQLGGAHVRENPDYNAVILITLNNGTPIQVLPERMTAAGAVWVRVRVVEESRDEAIEGWIVETLLRTATPAATDAP